MNKIQKIYVYTDGGSRGNPGESAIGVHITDDQGNKLYGFGKCIGVTTNNVAEYTAVLEALAWLAGKKDTFPELVSISFFLDSQLVYSQIVGLYKIKNATLRNILFLIRVKEAEIHVPILYAHIPREKNKEADRLVNLALDNPPLVTYN